MEDIADDIIYKHLLAPEDILGLDHVDKSGKPRSAEETTIVIGRG
jgi:ubiquitin carboxyl-terminal hydrolase 7